MAFTTTQAVDNILLRGITFRTTGNAAISTQYILYANGQGQTYWSNAVLPVHLSTLSTSLALQNVALSTNISTLRTTVAEQSTFADISYKGWLSSASTLLFNDRQLSNNFQLLSNQFGIVSNSLAVRVDAIYTSTIRFVESTLLGISSISTFYSEISAVQSSVNIGLSTLSTTIGVQNTSTYSTLTTNYRLLLNLSLISTTNYVNEQVSSLSSVVALGKDLSTFSTTSINQLLSTSDGLYKSITDLSSFTSTQFGRVYSSLYISSIIPLQSTSVGVQKDIDGLRGLSTNYVNITNRLISTFVSTSQSYQDQYIYVAIQNNSNSILDLDSRNALLTQSYSTFSSQSAFAYQSTLSSITGLGNDLSTLHYEYSVLTTSSILGGVYDSFMQLEGYTSSLINSTVQTVDTFKSTLYYSTVVQNQSISQAFFNEYVSTLYSSTLSTVIPSTISFTSSLVSSLYSTGTFYMFSSLNSSMSNITTNYISSTSSFTQQIISSSTNQLNSSILGYLSSPSANLLSTYSSLFGLTLSTFGSNSSNALSSFSTSAGSTLSFVNTSYSSIYTSSLNTISSLNAFGSSFSISASNQLSTNSTLFGRQLSTQNSLFNSTITAYPTSLISSINSTNASVYAFATSSATSTLNTIQSSTIVAYNNFLNSLDPSTITLSSLYTTQTLNLTGNSYNGVMDLFTYRNFTVNIYNVLEGSSNYRLYYTSNSVGGLDYRKGVITLNISTVGSSYSNNGGQLRFDVYRWGIPTTIWNGIYPLISNSDYTAQYEYTIMNNTVFTNLLNVYPRLAVINPTLSTIRGWEVYLNTFGTYTPGYYWRGSPIQVSWSNYSFFPFRSVGAPPYEPEVNIDVVVNGVSVANYGPYPLSVSTATIAAPYIRSQSVPVIPTTVRTYIVGKPMEAAENTFFTVLPTFDTIRLYPRNWGAASQFLAGGELVGITDGAKYPFYSTTQGVFNSGSNAFTSLNNDPQYRAANLVNGILNRAGFIGSYPSTIIQGASNVLQRFTENSASVGYPDFYVNLGVYFDNLLDLQTLGSQLTFTFANATASRQYTFASENLINAGGGIWRIRNAGISKPTNTFTVAGETCFIRMTYSRIGTINSIGSYTESNFVGPYSNSAPDIAVRCEIYNTGSASLIASMDPLSTLTFYNITSAAPIATSNTTSNYIVGAFSYAGTEYSSTFTLVASAAGVGQTFRV